MKNPSVIDWPQLKRHREQYRLWTTKHRFVKVAAGRGSGKTELARRRCVVYLPVKKPWSDPKYFYAAPTYNQVKRVAWGAILSLIPKGWIRSVSTSELLVTTIFGTELHFIGLDKPQRIEGVQWDGGVIDESSDVKPGTFERSVLPALTWRDAWCWRIGVPKRFGIGATEFREAWELGLQDGSSFGWPSSEIVPPVALEEAKRVMDERDYLEQFEAKWQSAAGAIFYKFDDTVNVRPCSYNRLRPILVGQDFNVDPMCWVLAHRYEDVIEVFDEVFLRNANTETTLNKLAAKYRDHEGGWAFYGDASGRARKTSAAISPKTNTALSDVGMIVEHEEFKRMGRSVNYLKSNPSIADRFAATNARLCSADGVRHLYIDSRCKKLIFDLSSRGYKPGTRKPDDSGDIGHITDALGYILYKLYPIRVPIDSTKKVQIAIT